MYWRTIRTERCWCTQDTETGVAGQLRYYQYPVGDHMAGLWGAHIFTGYGDFQKEVVNIPQYLLALGDDRWIAVADYVDDLLFQEGKFERGGWREQCYKGHNYLYNKEKIAIGGLIFSRPEKAYPLTSWRFTSYLRVTDTPQPNVLDSFGLGKLPSGEESEQKVMKFIESYFRLNYSWVQ